MNQVSRDLHSVPAKRRTRYAVIFDRPDAAFELQLRKYVVFTEENAEDPWRLSVIPTMDLNVCSRRVHDGYATIRSRGRSRPRALYRSDSEEFLKDAGGPYALPRVSNLPLAGEEGVHLVPRWTDLDKDRPFENYGTLRGSSKKPHVQSQDEPRRVTLNTFSGKRVQGHGQGAQEDGAPSGQGHSRAFNGEKAARSEERRIEYPVQGRVREKEDRLYDSVPPEDGVRNQRVILKSFAKSKAVRPEQNGFSKPALQRQAAVVVLDVAPRKVRDREGSDLKTENVSCNGVSAETDTLKKRKVLKSFSKDGTENARNGILTHERQHSGTRKSKKVPQNFNLRSRDSLEKAQREENVRNDRAVVSPFYAKVPQPEIVQNGFSKLEDQLQIRVNDDLDDGRSKKLDEAPLLDAAEFSRNIAIRPRQDSRSRKANSENDAKANGVSKEKQPIYAVPNVLSKTRRDRRVVVVDGNYVPSGDLYRTAAKYIEDINRNIAEIDRSYEELKSTSGTKSSAYGVINKIAKGASSDPSANAYSYHRKMDMAPMPPISPNFGESAEERNEATSADLNSRQNVAINKSRPNSYGRLPPKLLPRSSSIENTSRHSTGSTATSSTRSTESLYAISESFAELPRSRTVSESNRSDSELRHSFKIDVSKRDDAECDTDGAESKDDLSSTDEDFHPDRPPITSAVRKNRSRVEANDRSSPSKKLLDASRAMILSRHRSQEAGTVLENVLEGRRYGTLPNRRPKVTSRPLHKSSEDVLDGERTPRSQTKSLRRICASTIDVSCRRDEGLCDLRITENDCDGSLPLYLMDATEIIARAQMERARRTGTTRGQEQFPRSFCARTRHNSLESEDDKSGLADYQSDISFATLPRRGSVAKEQALNDPLRRLSGNVPILEPLYEHAVSDPVKPRTKDNVIPWWELATRKYRHRSCPSLQAHVVSAFEQSLSNMTQRLQQLTATAEKKDSELQELRETIERLRKQSAEAGLNGPSNGRRHTLGDSDGTTGCTGNSNHQGASMARQLSADSVTSLNSLSSACSASSHHKKKGWLRSSFSKAFSRSRKNRHGSVSDAEDCKDGPGGELSAPNSPRLPTAAKHEGSRGQGVRSHSQKSPEHENPLTGSKSSSALYKKEDEDVDELKKQLREKDLVLTDIRLEALSSAHQLESLKDTVIKMRNEMLNLKQNNERLQRLVTSKSLTSSQSSLPSDPDRRFSMTEVASTVAALANGDNGSNADQLEDLNVPEHPVVPSTTSTSTEPAMEQDTDGKRINVAVYLGSEKNFNCNLISGNNSDNCVGEPPHCVIASVCISNKTTWDALDSTVRRCFKEYVSRVDPVTNLGLGVECVAAYHLGEASRCTTDSQHPELLPCGYLIGHVKTIYLVLSGYSWLAVDTLIPRSIVQRLISLLTEHHRVILCGPSGTGKSYLAGKLAHALVDADNEVKDAAAVATFNVDHKSSKELRQYLAHIAERCDSNAADELPRVIILENLQHAASLSELFSGLLGTRHSSCPAIIGTMSQATCSTTNLQLHHNFRWVLCANHMEPVKGFLGRYLRRKLLEHELRESGGIRNAEMAAVVEWLPRVWQHLNKFLETHSSSDVTIGPRLFLSCPMEVAGSQVWFTDLWNYSVIPYLVEAVREGLTLYGRRVSGNGNGESTWEDPAQFIMSSYPWISTHAVHGGSEALLRLRPEDVGYDVVTSGHTSGVGASSVKSLGSTHSDTEGDPLLNMLMRLQEAANYSSPHSNDSDSVTSLDSSHTRHSEDLSSSTSSSRGVESAL